MIRLAGRFTRMAALCCLMLGTMQAASAQQTWSLSGVSFPARDGWCSKETVQDGAPALEVRSCGADFPYMSMSVGGKSDGSATFETATLLQSGIAYAGGAEAKKLIQGVIDSDNVGKTCTMLTYEVKTDPAPGVKGFSVEASYDCNGNPANPGWVRNFTTFATTKSGDVWIVSFDYPLAPITSGDIAMLQSAIFTIQNH